VIYLRIDISDILWVWARRWGSFKGIKGYPNLQSFIRDGKVVQARYAISDLSDDMYLRIDSALDILRQQNLEAYQVLMAIYLQGQDKRNVCLEMALRPSTFDNLLRTAKDFMSGAMFGSGAIQVIF